MEIPVTAIKPVRIGQVENAEAGTGCTVLIVEHGMAAGLDVRGGGPASRESQLLNPLMAAQTIHAVVLSGGSAYGLGTWRKKASGMIPALHWYPWWFRLTSMIYPWAIRKCGQTLPWGTKRPGLLLRIRTIGMAIMEPDAGQRSERSPEWKPA